MKYRGLHIVPSLSSRGTLQGYQVKRLISDGYALHLIPKVFSTERKARLWADTFNPSKVGHPLTKEDKTILEFKDEDSKLK